MSENKKRMDIRPGDIELPKVPELRPESSSKELLQKRALAAAMFERLVKFHHGREKALQAIEQQTDLGPNVIASWLEMGMVDWPEEKYREQIFTALERLTAGLPAIIKPLAVERPKQTFAEVMKGYVDWYQTKEPFTAKQLGFTHELAQRLLDDEIIIRSSAKGGISTYRFTQKALDKYGTKK